MKEKTLFSNMNNRGQYKIVKASVLPNSVVKKIIIEECFISEGFKTKSQICHIHDNYYIPFKDV